MFFIVNNDDNTRVLLSFKSFFSSGYFEITIYQVEQHLHRLEWNSVFDTQLTPHTKEAKIMTSRRVVRLKCLGIFFLLLSEGTKISYNDVVENYAPNRERCSAKIRDFTDDIFSLFWALHLAKHAIIRIEITSTQARVIVRSAVCTGTQGFVGTKRIEVMARAGQLAGKKKELYKRRNYSTITTRNYCNTWEVRTH